MKIISAVELKQGLDEGSILLIDVRQPAEHYAESIDGAYLIPLSELCCEKLPSISKPIVLQCRLGKRSMQAGYKLLAENPNLELFSLEGGIVAWCESGFDTKKSV